MGLLGVIFGLLVEFVIGGDGMFDGESDFLLEIASYQRMIGRGILRAVVVVVVRGATSKF